MAVNMQQNNNQAIGVHVYAAKEAVYTQTPNAVMRYIWFIDI